MQVKKSGLHHAELQRTRIKKDEEAESKVRIKYVKAMLFRFSGKPVNEAELRD